MFCAIIKVLVIDVCYFVSQPIQDKEILAEDEQTFLARQQVSLLLRCSVDSVDSATYIVSVQSHL